MTTSKSTPARANHAPTKRAAAQAKVREGGIIPPINRAG